MGGVSVRIYLPLRTVIRTSCKKKTDYALFILACAYNYVEACMNVYLLARNA